MPTQEMTPERRDLWFLRMYYLFWFGGMAFTSPFYALFLLSIGLTGTQIGTLSASGAVISLIAAPWWAARYESWKHPLSIMRIMLTIMAITYFMIAQQTTFAGVLAFQMLQALAGSSLAPIGDTVALRVTKAANTGYGSVRVFGSLSWVILVLVAGQIVEHFGLKYSIIGASVSVMLAVFIIAQVRPSNFVRHAPAADSPPEPAPVLPKQSALRGTLSAITSQPLVLGAAVMTLVIYIANNGVMQFQGSFLNRLGASDTIISVAGMLSALIELPAMIVVDRMLRKRSAYQLLMVAMLIYVGIRMIVFIAPSIGAIMLANASTGISYSILVVCVLRIVSDHTTPRNTRPVLAFINVTLMSVAGILGNPIAGMFFDHFGPRVLYAIGAMGYLLGFTIMFIAGRTAARRQTIAAAQSAG